MKRVYSFILPFLILLAEAFSTSATTYYYVGGNATQNFDASTAVWATTLGGVAVTPTVSSANIFIVDGSNVGGGIAGTNVTLNLTGSIAVGQFVLNNATPSLTVTISGAYTLSVGSSAAVPSLTSIVTSNDLSVPANCTLTLNTAMVTLVNTASATVNNASIAGILNVNTGTVTFSQTSNSGTPNLISGTVNMNTLGDNLVLSSGVSTTISGTVNLNLGGITNSAGLNTLITATATISMNGGAFTGANPTWTTGGTLQYVYSLAPQYIGADIAGNTSVEWPVSGTNLPSKVIINNSFGVLDTGVRTFRAGAPTLTLTAGAFTPTTVGASTGTITFPSGLTIIRDVGSLATSGAGSFVFPGKLAKSLSVKYNGSTGVVSGIEIPVASTVLNNLTVSKSGGVVLGTSATVNGILFLTGGIVTSTYTNLLTMASGSLVGSVSNLSFVSGPVAKVGNTAFTFPIGKDAKYRPLSDSALSASDTYIAEYIHVDPDDSGYATSSHVASLQNVSKCEYWKFYNTGATTAFVKLSWDTAYSCTVNDAPDLRVAQWDGVFEWNNEGNFYSYSQLVMSNLISTFSPTMPLTLASIDSTEDPLPISLLNFTARRNANVVDIDWSTTIEVNNDYFTVEKTQDLINYRTVVTLKGAGNSSTLLNYHTVDNSPYTGVSFYRLKQTDYDGKFTYSKPEPVNFGNSLPVAISIYPNPALDKVYISASQAGSYIAHVFDVKGSEVMAPGSVILEEGNLFSLDVHTLAAGIYTLQLVSGSGTLQQKIVKQ